MNIPVLIVAIVMALAVIAHVIGGTRETLAIEPSAEEPKLMAHWVQALCAFQMLAIDLLAVTALLFAIALWDLGPQEPTITLALAALFFLWGTVWLIQVLWLKRPAVTPLRLPHWIIWFVCSGFLVWGRQG